MLDVNHRGEGRSECAPVRDIKVYLKGSVAPDDVISLGTIVPVPNETNRQPKHLTVRCGVAADSDAALAALGLAAKQWCCGEEPHTPCLQPRRALWCTSSPGVDDSWSFMGSCDDRSSVAFHLRTLEELGYRGADREEAIVFACCQW